MFLKQGKRYAVLLSWRKTRLAHIDNLAESSHSPLRVSQTPPITSLGGYYWITLRTLGPEAQQIVQAVRNNQDALKASRLVIIDLRGNGGGDSTYAKRIAELLVGRDRVSAIEGTPSPCAGEYWRATQGNLHELQDDVLKARRDDNEQAEAFFAPVVRDMAIAVAGRQAFSPELPPCAPVTPSAETSAYRQHVIQLATQTRLLLVTDHYCFSSCLIAVDLFRRLGALQLGETTDMSSRYIEVREILLPSGLRTFSTLQKVALGANSFGP